MSVSYAVVADARRAEPAAELADRLGALLVTDNGSLSVWENHARAWRAAACRGTGWTVVLQDDAIPGEDFEKQVNTALSSLPAPGIMGLYVGISRPPQWQARIEAAITASDATQASWIKAHVLLWGVGVAIPSDRVLRMLELTESSPLPYDLGIGWWAQRERLPIWYPSHSLIDHADWPTLIRHADGQPRVEPRRAWRVLEPPHEWNGRYVAL